MKTHNTLLTLVATFSVLAGSHAIAATSFVADFSQDPPYTLSNSIVGANGWAQEGQSGNGNATIVDFGGTNRLALTGTISNSIIQVLNTNALISPDTNGMVFISTQLGWGRSLTSQGASLSFGPNDYNANTPLSVGFDSSNGIYYSLWNGGSYVGATTLLSVGNTLHDGSLYDFQITLNYNTKKFDITLTGLDSTNGPVNVSLTNQTFYNAYWDGGGIYQTFIQNNGVEYQDMYVGGINIVPEPSTYALIGMGAAGMVGYMIRRRRRA